MSESVQKTELIIKTMAETIVANERYFCKLDEVVGDGDMGYSLARGWEIILRDFDSYDRASVSAFLKKIGFVISSKIGGSSGPIWGTGFIRAAAAAGDKNEISSADTIAMLRAAVAGIQQRGGAELGEKTLLDALVPAIDSLEKDFAENLSSTDAIERAAKVCATSAEATKNLIAKRGRAAYTGERSIGSPDAGAMAIAVIFTEISRAWRNKSEPPAVAGGFEESRNAER